MGLLHSALDQQVYSCCHNFLAVTQSYNIKNTYIKKFLAVKITKSCFLYVFIMAFPTSPFKGVSFFEGILTNCNATCF